MKILFLPLKKQWYDMICSGIKKEEYRVIKPFWTVRLMEKDNITFKGYTHVKFTLGYTHTSMVFEIDSISIRKGKPEWGAESNQEYYVIALGNRISE